LKATARNVRTLTGEILCPKTAGFRGNSFSGEHSPLSKPFSTLRRGHFRLGKERFHLRRSHLHPRKGHFHLGRVHFHLGRVHFHLGKVHLHLGKVHLHLGKVHLRLGKEHFRLGKVHFRLGRGLFPFPKACFPSIYGVFWNFSKDPAVWDSDDPDMNWDNPNLIWSDPSYILEPGDPGYVPPSPPPTPTPNKNMKTHTPHCPIPVIVYNGNLVVAAAQKYPKVITRLPADYLTETTTSLGKLPTDVAVQKDARGETGNLTAAQQKNLDTLLYWMRQARKTARLAFFGQTVKLHEEFLMGVQNDHGIASVLGRADTILASVQKTDNLAALKIKGWTDADTQNFVAARSTFPASTVVQQSAQSEAKKKTIAKTTDASDAYEHVLTIQHAGDLEYPAIDPDNAPIRAEFRLDIFPPTQHTPDATPTPTPATPKP
jgi:hypothetical protein